MGEPVIPNIVDVIEGLLRKAIEMTPSVVIGAVLFVFFIMLGRVLGRTIVRTTAKRSHSNVGLILGRLGSWVVFLAGGLVALMVMSPSMKPADLLSILGVSGVAIGFAFKDILQNFLAGILILLHQPFRPGDEIKFQEYEGRVESIDTRLTALRTIDGRRVLIPNGELFVNSVVINSIGPARRCELIANVPLSIGVADYLEPIAHSIGDIDGVLPEPAPDTQIQGFAVGEGARLVVSWWALKENVRETRNDIARLVQTHIHEGLEAQKLEAEELRARNLAPALARTRRSGS